MLRTIVPMQVQGPVASSWAIVLKLAAGTVALLGSYHAVSGATAIVTPYSVNAQVGQPYNRQLTTSVRTAQSWSANTAPLRSAVFPLTPGLWLTNSNGRIGGVPTQAVTSSIPITAWENSGNSGNSITATFLFTVTNAIVLPPVAPTIITQPQSLSRNVGTVASFSVIAAGTQPLSFQWRLNGTNIPSAVSSNYARIVQVADAGNYSVVITNIVGSVTSSNATLTVVIPTADVSVSSRGPPTALPNGTVVYTITVTNAGPSAASTVVISDRIPPNSTFVSATGGPVLRNGLIIWPTIATLGARGSSNYTVTVSAPADGVLTNTVFGNSSTVDPNPGNNDGSSSAAVTLTTVFSEADLIVVQAGPASVLSTSEISYTISVTNLGPSTASNVVVSDQLPGAVTFVSASDGGINADGVVTWPVISSLAAGEATNFVVSVKAPIDGSFTNFAFASASTADPDPSNNDGSSAASQVFSTVVNPQADVITTVVGPSNVVANGSVTYLVTVTNIGPSAANNLQVFNALPSNASFVSASSGGVSSNGIVAWPLLTDLPSGAAATFTVTVTAPASGEMLESVFSTSSSPDPLPSNNDGTDPSANVITTVGFRADVAVLSSGPAYILPEGTLVYLLLVTNAGPFISSNVVVQDFLPPGSSFVAATGGGFATGNEVTWPEITALLPGTSVSFALTITAAPNGVMTNVAAGNASTLDPNAGNNDGTSPASQVLTAVTAPQFSVSAEAPALNPQTGLFEERVSVSNQGPVSSPAVRLYVDGLRLGVQLYNASGTNAGRLYVQSNAALSPNQTASFLLKFYVADRRPFTNTFEAEWVLPAPSTSVSATGFAITRGFMDQRAMGSPRYVIEFSTAPGTLYTVIYSDDMQSWRAAVPSFTASGTTTQWYDDGPPTTESSPFVGPTRFYRVVVGTAGP